MEVSERRSLFARVLSALGQGVKGAAKTMLRLAALLAALSLAAFLLREAGVLAPAARICSPITRFFGLPGEAILPLLAAFFFNVYAGLALALSISLNAREMTILAIFCLIAHSMTSESASMKKTGSSVTKMAALRLFAGLAAAWAFSRLLPQDMAKIAFSRSSRVASFVPTLRAWAISTGILILKIAAFVLGLSLVQRLLEEFKVLPILSKLVSPAMLIFGLPASDAYPFVVMHVIDYQGASRLVAAEIEAGNMKPQDGDLFNHHAAVCHSLLEDSALFGLAGLSLFWIIVPRLILAAAVVWIERARRRYFRRSFRAGVA
jgi:spore maturation protein SpmB